MCVPITGCESTKDHHIFSIRRELNAANVDRSTRQDCMLRKGNEGMGNREVGGGLC